MRKLILITVLATALFSCKKTEVITPTQTTQKTYVVNATCSNGGVYVNGICRGNGTYVLKTGDLLEVKDYGVDFFTRDANGGYTVKNDGQTSSSVYIDNVFVYGSTCRCDQVYSHKF
jgi:protein involved in polysaccharide export with SLBB domain